MNNQFIIALLILFFSNVYVCCATDQLQADINEIYDSSYPLDEKIALLEQLEKNSKDALKRKSLGLLYHKLGRLYSGKNQQKAIEYFEKALDIRLSSESKDILAANQSRFSLSVVYGRLGEKE
ncbi:MAG: hypothetical protein WBA74_11195, partial [Cyclobacteriaceae bacterium]